MRTLRERLKEAGLDYATVERLSGGVLTDSKLRKANAEIVQLAAEDTALLDQIVGEYIRMTCARRSLRSRCLYQ